MPLDDWNLPPGFEFLPSCGPEHGAPLRSLPPLGGLPAADGLPDDRALALAPAGSLLDVVLEVFRTTTHIPLAIPLFNTLAFVSGILLREGVEIDVAGMRRRPSLWSICVGPSGSGKTAMQNHLKKYVSLDFLPTGATAVRFLEELKNNNNSLWLQDEWGKFARRIATRDGYTDYSAYLLDIYSGQTVRHGSTVHNIEVKEPCISIWGQGCSVLRLR
jgi:hypothetical protein